ncbi:hypothetical protein [Bacillus pinisoli]|uniref:hypothetical protein n=1 Tax=Bacillus pinisoli TaxID=2901866 RepID=UPI001FF39C7F|nr:hypothetical protein [Bacillus pinisoli]
MYKKVVTQEDLRIFDSVWIPAWQEKGFDLECLLGPVDRYLIKDNHEEVIGTVGFRAYNFDSPIDDVYPFKTNQIICNNKNNIIEIDKLAIIKEQRGIENLERVLLTIIDYARHRDYQYYIATIDAAFYKVIQKIYPTSLYTLHKRIKYKDTYLVPIIIDAHYTLSNTHKYYWLRKYFSLLKEYQCRYCREAFNSNEVIKWSQRSTDNKMNFNYNLCSNCLGQLVQEKQNVIVCRV